MRLLHNFLTTTVVSVLVSLSIGVLYQEHTDSEFFKRLKSSFKIKSTEDISEEVYNPFPHSERMSFRSMDFSKCYPSLLANFPEIKSERYIIYSESPHAQVSFFRTCVDQKSREPVKVFTCDDFDRICGVETFKYVPCPEGYYAGHSFRNSFVTKDNFKEVTEHKMDLLNKKIDDPKLVCIKSGSEPTLSGEIPMEYRNIPTDVKLGK